MDMMDIYGDLDDFQEKEDKKSKELLELETKYNEALKTIEALKMEKKDLRKKIRIMEKNLQSLHDTAKAEINRKDKTIEQLRKEKDDICFRRSKATVTSESCRNCNAIKKSLSTVSPTGHALHVENVVKQENTLCSNAENFSRQFPICADSNDNTKNKQIKEQSKTSEVNRGEREMSTHTSSNHYKNKGSNYENTKKSEVYNRNQAHNRRSRSSSKEKETKKCYPSHRRPSQDDAARTDKKNGRETDKSRRFNRYNREPSRYRQYFERRSRSPEDRRENDKYHNRPQNLKNDENSKKHSSKPRRSRSNEKSLETERIKSHNFNDKSSKRKRGCSTDNGVHDEHIKRSKNNSTDHMSEERLTIKPEAIKLKQEDLNDSDKEKCNFQNSNESSGTKSTLASPKIDGKNISKAERDDCFGSPKQLDNQRSTIGMGELLANAKDNLTTHGGNSTTTTDAHTEIVEKSANNFDLILGRQNLLAGSLPKKIINTSNRVASLSTRVATQETRLKIIENPAMQKISIDTKNDRINDCKPDFVDEIFKVQKPKQAFIAENVGAQICEQADDANEKRTISATFKETIVETCDKVVSHNIEVADEKFINQVRKQNSKSKPTDDLAVMSSTSFKTSDVGYLFKEAVDEKTDAVSHSILLPSLTVKTATNFTKTHSESCNKSTLDSLTTVVIQRDSPTDNFDLPTKLKDSDIVANACAVAVKDADISTKIANENLRTTKNSNENGSLSKNKLQKLNLNELKQPVMESKKDENVFGSLAQEAAFLKVVLKNIPAVIKKVSDTSSNNQDNINEAKILNFNCENIKTSSEPFAKHKKEDAFNSPKENSRSKVEESEPSSSALPKENTASFISDLCPIEQQNEVENYLNLNCESLLLSSSDESSSDSMSLAQLQRKQTIEIIENIRLPTLLFKSKTLSKRKKLVKAHKSTKCRNSEAKQYQQNELTSPKKPLQNTVSSKIDLIKPYSSLNLNEKTLPSPPKIKACVSAEKKHHDGCIIVETIPNEIASMAATQPKPNSNETCQDNFAVSDNASDNLNEPSHTDDDHLIVKSDVTTCQQLNKPLPQHEKSTTSHNKQSISKSEETEELQLSIETETKESKEENKVVITRKRGRPAKTAQNTAISPSSSKSTLTSSLELLSTVAIAVAEQNAAKVPTALVNAEIKNSESLPSSLLSPTTNQKLLLKTPTFNDAKFKEIEESMQAIFQSPLKTGLEETATATSLSTPPEANDNIKKTNASNQAHHNLLRPLTSDSKENPQQQQHEAPAPCKSTTSTLSPTPNVEHSSRDDPKRLSLGATEYLVERVSENVISMFITRKKRKKVKNSNKEANTPL